jgi:hypothetical protein
MPTHSRYAKLALRAPERLIIALPFIWLKADSSHIYLRTALCDITLCPDSEAGRQTKIVTSDEDAWECRLSHGEGITIVNT